MFSSSLNIITAAESASLVGNKLTFFSMYFSGLFASVIKANVMFDTFHISFWTRSRHQPNEIKRDETKKQNLNVKRKRFFVV